MSELRQTANGKWNIVDICHDQAGITIPAKFTYSGVTKSFNITTQKKNNNNRMGDSGWSSNKS